MNHLNALPHAIALNARISFFAPAPARASLLTRLGTAVAAARTRRALAQLDAHQLADIGLTQEQASAEANRPLWDAPRFM